MKRKQKTIKIVTPVVALSVLLAMCFAFFADGKRPSGKSEAIESFYGRANFGGKFGWMTNVKRPEISKMDLSGEFLTLNLGANDALDSVINPNDGLNFQASFPSNSSYMSVGLYQPFDNQSNLFDLVSVEQNHPDDIPIFDGGNGGGSSGGGNWNGYYTRLSIIDSNDIYCNGDVISNNGIGDNDKPVVVPAPAAALLAAIGAMAVSVIKKIDGKGLI